MPSCRSPVRRSSGRSVAGRPVATGTSPRPRCSFETASRPRPQRLAVSLWSSRQPRASWQASGSRSWPPRWRRSPRPSTGTAAPRSSGSCTSTTRNVPAGRPTRRRQAKLTYRRGASCIHDQSRRRLRDPVFIRPPAPVSGHARGGRGGIRAHPGRGLEGALGMSLAQSIGAIAERFPDWTSDAARGA